MLHSGRRRAAPADQMDDKRQDKEHYEDDEQNLRDIGSKSRYATETEKCSHNRKQKEKNGPAKHGHVTFLFRE
jgi:hypothetical protein